MSLAKEHTIEYGWDDRAGVWCGVVRNEASAWASNPHILALKIRHQLGDAMPPEARFTLKRTGPDKPRPT